MPQPKTFQDQLLHCLMASLTSFTRYPVLRHKLQKLAFCRPVNILAIGKAAYQMAYIASRSIPKQLQESCIVLTKYGFFPPDPRPDFAPQILEAGHPIPDANSLQHSADILNWMQQIPPDQDLIILLSGGSSALFELPAAGHSLDQLQQLNSLLLKSGLDIAQINARRRQYSALKGGKAAKYFRGKSLVVFLLSDVPGNDPAIIGSAPFYSPDVQNHHLVADNQAWLKALAKELKRRFEGYPLRLSTRFVTADAVDFAQALAHYAQSATPGCYLFGGECSLQVKGKGKGGRLSHLALCFAQAASAKKQTTLCAYASDGNDHLPQFAGAIVDQDSWELLQQQGNPQAALANFDSYSILSESPATIPASYTGTNVNDLILLFVPA
jgi:glycerate 2-kinase